MNFDKEKFSKILTKIKNTYGSINLMADKTGITAAYISKLIRLMYDNAPSPEILKKISDHSNGITNYEELMRICGYFDASNIHNLELSGFLNHIEDFYKLGLSDEQIDYIFFYIISEQLEDGDECKKEFSNFLLSLPPNTAHKLLDILSNMYSNIENILDEKHNLNTYVSNKLTSIPVYGQISAGLPNWAEECLEGYLPIDPNLMNIINPEECFFLKVNGESMNKVIRNGAYALIRKQDIVENGEIAAILVNGDDATIKKFTKHGDLVVLEPMSDDTTFQVQIYDKSTSIKILGKYIGKFEINN